METERLNYDPLRAANKIPSIFRRIRDALPASPVHLRTRGTPGCRSTSSRSVCLFPHRRTNATHAHLPSGGRLAVARSVDGCDERWTLCARVPSARTDPVHFPLEQSRVGGLAKDVTPLWMEWGGCEWCIEHVLRATALIPIRFRVRDGAVRSIS